MSFHSSELHILDAVISIFPHRLQEFIPGIVNDNNKRDDCNYILTSDDNVLWSMSGTADLFL